MDLELEIWKDIPGYEGYYQVSSFGRVKSLPRIKKNKNTFFFTKEKIIYGSLKTGGYISITLYKEDNVKQIDLHVIVAITFLNHKPDGMKYVVDHIDNNKTNNNINNLQIISQRENVSKDRKKSSKCTSKYTGVSWDKIKNKWRAVIVINGKTKFLGNFECEIAAAFAYTKQIAEIKKIKNI